MSVLTLVGWIALTRICSGARVASEIVDIVCDNLFGEGVARTAGPPSMPAVFIAVAMNAATDPVTMIDAPACRCFMLACTRLMTPTRSTSTASTNACGGSPAVNGQIPALATTMSSLPNSATPRSIAADSAARSRTSAISVYARLPSFSTSRAVSSRSSGRASGYSLVSMSAQMSTAMMSAPSAASSRACDRPCPRAAPLISATLPSPCPSAALLADPPTASGGPSIP